MFARIGYTWRLMGASWEVLKQDKEMLLFPLLSGICCVMVLASFALPMWVTGSWRPPVGEATTDQQVLYYSILFLFYLCNYFVITFFNTAIISCAVMRLSGGNPTVGDGFREALSRIHLILGWALVSATVGLILRIIEDRSEKVGRIVAGLLGMAWTVISFLVVPILVVERKGPFAALKESTSLLRRTWGEQIVGHFSFGMVFFAFAMPAILLIVAGIFSQSAVGLGVCIGLAVVYLMVLSLIQSALQSIFQAAVYLHARGDAEPKGYPTELLSDAMGAKR